MTESNRKLFKLFLQRVGELLYKKDVFFNASAITFNLFICAVPFTLILISILGYILSIDAAFEELLRYGRELFPSFTFETQSGDIIEGAITLEDLIEPLVGARQVFGILGLAILLIFAQGLFHTLKHVLFEVYDIEDRKNPVIELIYNFFAFGVIGGVFVFFTMAISIISLFTFDSYEIPYTDIVLEFGWVADLLTTVVPIVFTLLLFYVIYRYISEKRMNREVALLATIFYTFLFEVAKYGISIYLEYALTAYRYFYQGYTILIIIGLWVFYTAVLYVVTTIVARAFQEIYLNDPPVPDSNPYTSIS